MSAPQQRRESRRSGTAALSTRAALPANCTPSAGVQLRLGTLRLTGLSRCTFSSYWAVFGNRQPFLNIDTAQLSLLDCLVALGPLRSPQKCGEVSVAREQRKLAAILASDVVGYSRLMGRDESGTLARLRKNRAERLDPVLAKYGGRLVKLIGDGALVEFGSAVDALSAAIEFQQVMAEANCDQPADDALVFRMGLHLGDLIVDGDDLYGDSVNIAARLEAQAPPGGILISQAVHEAVTGRLKATFTDRGSLALKNIERPVQAFQVRWDTAD